MEQCPHNLNIKGDIRIPLAWNNLLVGITRGCVDKSLSSEFAVILLKKQHSSSQKLSAHWQLINNERALLFGLCLSHW